MTVYVDKLQDWGWWSKSGGSCHMASDVSESELRAFARQIGLPDAWYQSHPDHPHYDLSATWRRKAIQAGAVALPNSEFVKKCSRMFNPAIGA